MKATLRTWIRQKVRDVVDDDETRFRMQLGWVFRILTLVVLVMIVVNTLTREFESIPAMAGFGGISIICALLLEKKPGWKWGVIAAMMAAVLGLFGYFIITGEPEGFSPVWIVLTPSAALLLLGRWNGLKLCAVQFAMLAFLMWTPWGRELLQYPYEESFLLRLPMVYIAAFWISWFLEYVREATQKRLPSGSETVRTTVSIGLTVCPTLPVEKERLLTLTDQCLYRAKKAGKNRCEWTEYSA